MEDMGIGYNIAILFHVVGILLLFAALTLQLQALIMLKKTRTTANLQAVGKAMHRLSPMFGVASGVILLSGIYLSYVHLHEGGAGGWLAVAITVFVVMGIFGSVSGRQLETKVAAAAAGAGQLDASAGNVSHMAVSVAMFLSILILMIFQPSLPISIIVALACLAVGVVAARTLGREA